MALTPDTIAVDDESLMDRFYEPNKTKIWAVIAIVFLGMVGFVAVRHANRTAREEMWSRYHTAKDLFDLNPLAEIDAAAARKQIDAMSSLVREYPDDTITPYALERLAKAQFAVGEFDAATKSLEEIQTRFKDFPANTMTADPDASGRARSVTEKLLDAVKSEKAWAERRTYVHHWPTDDRLALVETNAGSFWLGFYSSENEAPQHVESFVRHAKAGDYNGTQIYEIRTATDGSAELFSGGSKASGLPDKGGVLDPSLHDADEPTNTAEPEESRSTIRHQYRVVSAAKMPSGESSMRFTVVTKKGGLERLNGETTPFAAVMDREGSLAVIDKIAHGSTYRNHPKTQAALNAYKFGDHPYPNVFIRRVSIWSKEKLEEGHTWNTAKVATDQPEDWEAARGEGPLPDDFKDAPLPPPKKEEDTKNEPPKDEGK